MYFFTLFVIYTSLYTLYSNPSPLYFTYQEAWPSSLAWKCSGTPILKGQRVQFIEEATKVYYDTLMSGRFIEDKNLDIVIPPNSILKSKDYLNMLNLVIHTSTKNLGNPVVMRINCELMNNLKWVKEVYNRALSRNTKIFRAILDIIYRLGLCFREIDPHLNCPDICRSKTDKFCKNKPYTVGFCGTYMNDLLRDAKINYTEEKKVKELKRNLKDWLLHVPVERRLPMEFFLHFTSNKKLFVKAIEIQRQSSLIAYCPCEAKYIYDRISDTCSDIKGEHGCYSDSYCANGGTCVQNLGMNHLESGLLCQCPPAFKGTQCEYERNPCEDEVGCAPFPCVRDPQNLEYGFRCQCPTTHQYQTKGEPKCVPVPVCGEFNITSELKMKSQPCRNSGQCIQNTNDSTLYKCICNHGYTGDHCEIEPTPAIWSVWSAWSNCVWPDLNEICHIKPYRQQTRTCITYVIGQKCVGETKRITHIGCDLSVLHSKSDINISQTKREDLINAVKLCDLYSQQYVMSTSEYGLNEQLITVEEVDDRSTTGFQNAPQPHLNESIGTDQSQSANFPTRRDYLLTTGWIYVIVLHIGTILLWIHYIHRWRTQGRD
uniref:Cadherin EGF LAG seven-pass G-type receptor 1 n=1 Tax=Schistosoma mansoni TaxID=6183 RepID=A0A5K4FFC3_SCHMA